MHSLRQRRQLMPTLLCLHLLLAIYAFGTVLSKTAALTEVFSTKFFLCYGGLLCTLAIYAIGWQQMIKRLPLTVAFANKAITVIWGMGWGAYFFDEHITAGQLVGAALVMAGIIYYSFADADEEVSL